MLVYVPSAGFINKSLGGPRRRGPPRSKGNPMCMKGNRHPPVIPFLHVRSLSVAWKVFSQTFRGDTFVVRWHRRLYRDQGAVVNHRGPRGGRPFEKPTTSSILRKSLSVCLAFAVGPHRRWLLGFLARRTRYRRRSARGGEGLCVGTHRQSGRARPDGVLSLGGFFAYELAKLTDAPGPLSSNLIAQFCHPFDFFT